MQTPHLGTLLKETFKGWHQEGASQISAALAYYAVFSIAPMLIIITFLVGLVHEGDTIEQVRIQFADFVRPEAADLIARGVVNAGLTARRGIGYTAIALIFLLVGASAFTHELKSAVDAMWSVKPRRGRKHALLRRLGTLLFGVAMGVLLQVSVVLNSETSAYRRSVDALLPGFHIVWHWVDKGFPFLSSLSSIL